MDIRQIITETNIFTIFIFILIISGNFLALVPCKLQDELNNNMYVKHLFGLFTMIFFVTLAAPVKDKTISANIAGRRPEERKRGQQGVVN